MEVRTTDREGCVNLLLVWDHAHFLHLVSVCVK
jgi:hypothetical protein